MRKRMFEIIEIGKDGDKLSKVYDFLEKPYNIKLK